MHLLLNQTVGNIRASLNQPALAGVKPAQFSRVVTRRVGVVRNDTLTTPLTVTALLTQHSNRTVSDPSNYLMVRLRFRFNPHLINRAVAGRCQHTS